MAENLFTLCNETLSSSTVLSHTMCYHYRHSDLASSKARLKVSIVEPLNSITDPRARGRYRGIRRKSQYWLKEDKEKKFSCSDLLKSARWGDHFCGRASFLEVLSLKHQSWKSTAVPSHVAAFDIQTSCASSPFWKFNSRHCFGPRIEGGRLTITAWSSANW